LDVDIGGDRYVAAVAVCEPVKELSGRLEETPLS
jgi:hypothetical protein